MKKPIKLTFNIRQTAENWVPDHTGRVSYTLGLGMVVLMISGIVLMWGKLPTRVPLYFSLPWGEIRLTNKLLLVQLPVLGLLVMGVNIGVAKIVSKLSALLPQIMGVGSAIVVLMLTLALVGILQSILL